MTLTTVGYDLNPETLLGKMIGKKTDLQILRLTEVSNYNKMFSVLTPFIGELLKRTKSFLTFN